MENHSLATEQRDALARSVVAQRDELAKAAIDFKLGRIDWTVEEIKGRGELIKYPDGRVVFEFDKAALLEFHPASWWSEKVDHVEKLVASQHYRVLCPELEVYLA